MSSSQHAQRPLMRSYRLPTPAPSPLERFGRMIVALILVGASVVGIVSISRGSAGGAVTPTAIAEPPAAAEPVEFVLPPMPPTFEPGHVRLVVDGGPTVALRAWPSLSSPVLVALLKGTVVEAVPSRRRSANADWRYVRWNQREGWIAANLVRVDTVPLEQVPIPDQGIDYWSPLQPGVYPLREISTGRPITDDGRPVYVDREGARVPTS